MSTPGCARRHQIRVVPAVHANSVPAAAQSTLLIEALCHNPTPTDTASNTYKNDPGINTRENTNKRATRTTRKIGSTYLSNKLSVLALAAASETIGAGRLTHNGNNASDSPAKPYSNSAKYFSCMKSNL